ncbi:aminotransferase class V-fold PLP-dependent enzyme [Streptomyces monticola]|uniref:Aminotransferase class V-fold PLP-dependent enzyme n=1 Tax=Streptomyces monticola TaxID=2666263 RepID=A0ABW2JPY8_9ACTN
MDALRKLDFPYVVQSGQAYLDYTGAALAPASLVRGQARRLTSEAYGNPHSASPASLASTRLAEAARSSVLDFCRADADVYTVVFTTNATAAIRLVAEAFPFAPHAPLLVLGDNHNSVLGMRRYAARRDAALHVVPLDADFRTASEAVSAHLTAAAHGTSRGLFAYPAQSNATGVRHPLRWVNEAQSYGWRVLLDAAAYLPTGRLDLRTVPADFVALSWYKITGLPTGVGCLIARKEALAELRRPWFAGGTVLASSSHTDWHLPAEAPEAFEDGTLPFLALPDVSDAAAWHTSIGYPAIQHHTGRLTSRLLRGLGELTYPGGEPAVRLLGPRDTLDRGPTVAFHLLRPDGTPIDERVCQDAATAAGVSVRTGCFCNPGVAEHAHSLTPGLVQRALARGAPATIDDYLRLLRVPVQGAVRVSLGIANDTTDVDRALQVYADLTSRPVPTVRRPRTGC